MQNKKTNLLMTITAIILALVGIFLTFTPDILLKSLQVTPMRITLLLVQIIGALYFAFATLNWMNKDKRMGGIYNRPITVANFTHFLIVGLALIRLVFSIPKPSIIIWITTIVYLIFGILFAILLFYSPLENKNT